MNFQNFMNQVRHFDNLSAKWIVRHFYLLFFELVLVVIFAFFLFNTTQFLDFLFDVQRDDLVQRLLVTEAISLLIIVLLLLLGSFWMLYIFNTMLRMQNTLRDIAFHLSRKKD